MLQCTSLAKSNKGRACSVCIVPSGLIQTKRLAQQVFQKSDVYWRGNTWRPYFQMISQLRLCLALA